MTFNKKEFFDHCRRTVMGPTLDQNEVQGSEFILSALNRLPISWTAYALATAWHETAHTMMPISERGGPAYWTRLYDVKGQNPARAIKYGNTNPGDGIKYRGRGYVQLTWANNYKKASNKVGIDLYKNPDEAMNPHIAAKIMRSGMVDGWFTGKKFSDYLPNGLATRQSFVNARRIINGTDKASLIAGYALDFQEALKIGDW